MSVTNIVNEKANLQRAQRRGETRRLQNQTQYNVDRWHEVDKSLCLGRAMTGGLENETAFDPPGNAVVIPLTVGLDREG